VGGNLGKNLSNQKGEVSSGSSGVKSSSAWYGAAKRKNSVSQARRPTSNYPEGRGSKTGIVQPRRRGDGAEDIPRIRGGVAAGDKKGKRERSPGEQRAPTTLGETYSTA